MNASAVDIISAKEPVLVLDPRRCDFSRANSSNKAQLKQHFQGIIPAKAAESLRYSLGGATSVALTCNKAQLKQRFQGIISAKTAESLRYSLGGATSVALKNKAQLKQHFQGIYLRRSQFWR